MSTTDLKKAPSRKWLYLPIMGFALLAGLYSAYWFYAMGKIEQGLDDWLAGQRFEGVEIDYAAREFGGFPYRFVVTFDRPSYRNWQGDWAGERLELFMQPWNYRHAIARAPGRNELVWQRFDGTAVLDEKSAASFRWNADGLTNIGLTLNAAEFITDQADASVRGLKASYALKGDATQFGLDWDGISVSPELLAGQELAFLGGDMQAGRLRVELTGLDSKSYLDGYDERSINLAQLILNWGPLKLGAKGDFDVTQEGHLDGLLKIRLDEAEALSNAMTEAGRGDFQSVLLIQAIGAASEGGEFLILRVKDGSLTIPPGVRLTTLPPVAPPLPVSGTGTLVE